MPRKSRNLLAKKEKPNVLSGFISPGNEGKREPVKGKTKEGAMKMRRSAVKNTPAYRKAKRRAHKMSLRMEELQGRKKYSKAKFARYEKEKTKAKKTYKGIRKAGGWAKDWQKLKPATPVTPQPDIPRDVEEMKKKIEENKKPRSPLLDKEGKPRAQLLGKTSSLGKRPVSPTSPVKPNIPRKPMPVKQEPTRSPLMRNTRKRPTRPARQKRLGKAPSITRQKGIKDWY